MLHIYYMRDAARNIIWMFLTIYVGKNKCLLLTTNSPAFLNKTRWRKDAIVRKVDEDQTSRSCSTGMAKLLGFFYVCFTTTQNNHSAEIRLNLDFNIDASRKAEAHQHVDGF